MKESTKRFDGMDIASLELTVENNRQMARESQKEMIEVLLYLKNTGRYKENKRYAKASFFAYIEDRFLIRQGSYYEMQTAYLKFPQETINYGVGLVSKTLRICGPVNAKQTLAEITKAGEQKSLTRANIDRIIQRYKDPERAKKTEKKDFKALYEHEVAAHEKTRGLLKAAVERNKELEEQIEKLKKTASIITGIKKVMKEGEGILASA